MPCREEELCELEVQLLDEQGMDLADLEVRHPVPARPSSHFATPASSSPLLLLSPYLFDLKGQHMWGACATLPGWSAGKSLKVERSGQLRLSLTPPRAAETDSAAVEAAKADADAAGAVALHRLRLEPGGGGGAMAHAVPLVLTLLVRPGAYAAGLRLMPDQHWPASTLMLFPLPEVRSPRFCSQPFTRLRWMVRVSTSDI